MNRAKLTYAADIALLVAFLALFTTGIIKFPGLLRALAVDYTTVPWGTISAVHDWAGAALGALVLIHVVLRWGMIVGMTKVFFARGGQ